LTELGLQDKQWLTRYVMWLVAQDARL